MKNNNIRERKVYFFLCVGCGKKRRQTFKLRKAKDQLCRTCRRSAIVAMIENKNQTKLDI